MSLSESAWDGSDSEVGHHVSIASAPVEPSRARSSDSDSDSGSELAGGRKAATARGGPARARTPSRGHSACGRLGLVTVL
jgi:hypothetical protein